ncbi:MAG: trypsin-like peptidase domain-containing protein [Demequinaceae bacterium]|nr:trypsin-like peptidase domain-containing protein [Demequinaceae bacterium]
MTHSRLMKASALAAASASLVACSVIPVAPEGLPEDWIPSVSPSPIDPDLLDSPLGFDPEQESAVRIRNSKCDELSSGSGFILDDHTIVTNRHVVEGFLDLEVNTSDGRDITVASAAVSQVSDIATITTVESLSPFAPLADEDPGLGDFVTIVGFPLGEEMTTTMGSVLQRSDDNLDNADHVFISSAEVEHGSSGSAAYDEQGEVFGVVYAGQDDSNYAIFIPISIVKESLANLDPLAAIKTCTY